MNNYRCDFCGCYLDPGEGHICDECQKRETELRDCRRSLQDSIHSMNGFQYELNLKGGYLYGEH